MLLHINNYDNFAIAFEAWRGMEDKYFLNYLYMYEGYWRRVAFHYSKCKTCDWQGTIANPMLPDLYITVRNRYEILRENIKMPFLNCPKCGGKITSTAIWIQPEE